MNGIILAIIMKHKKSDMKFHLYEKSYHKSNFLRDVSKKFDLNTKIFQKNKRNCDRSCNFDARLSQF